jgi:6-pyruvoyltetrahydropterin/6-carboxytetrahydropterin synthase
MSITMPTPKVTTTVTRRYSFEAAHFLPHVPEGHKCKRMHGHNYEIEVTVSGEVMGNGFIIDFWDLDKIVDPLVERLDHRTLNDIDGLDNPTAEEIAAWFLWRLQSDHRSFNITSVRCFETKNCWADASLT